MSTTKTAPYVIRQTRIRAERPATTMKPESDISAASSALGRRGGKAKSAAKTRAARQNAKKAGRPRQYLAEDIGSVAINPTTRQAINTGTLEAGCRVRGIRQHLDELEGTRWEFQVSQDGGKTWFLEESYEEPKVELR